VYASGVQPRKAECIERLGDIACGYDCKGTVAEIRCAQTPAGRCTTRLSEVSCWDPPFDERQARPGPAGRQRGRGPSFAPTEYSGELQARFRPVPAPVPSSAKAQKLPAQGKAGLVTDPVVRRDPAFHELLKKEIKRQQALGAWYEKVLRVPFNLSLNFTECEGSMSYRSPPPQIRSCYAFIEQVGKALDDSRVGDEVADFALTFSALHELGHALIHLLDLPMVGKEEDAADSFALIFLLQAYHPEKVASGQAPDIAAHLRAVMRFFNWRSSLGTHVSADEHGTPEQRAYNLACLTLGRDPKLAARVVGRKSLKALEERDCENEFQKALRSWNKLLRPNSNVVGGVTF